jgi:tetratricopeptide (TPR) repeat protein
MKADYPVINSRYQMVEKLGQGGMGEVYRAVDRLNRQHVALKRVITSPVFSSGDSDTARNSYDTRMLLANEFATLASLYHPHIIDVLDYGFDHNGSPFFTMELLASPQNIVDAAADAPLNTKIDLCVQMFQALAYLHHRHIIHRDLKPDNALVTKRQLKLLDFGLATLQDRQELDEEEGISGTISYMAPEILSGSKGSPQADLYAAGIIIYEIFAGRHPFNTSNLNSLIQNILVTPIDVDVLDVSVELGDIVRKLLEKDPEKRYASANEVIAAIAQATDLPIVTETVAIREGFLQSAHFVGRDKEMSQLEAALLEMLDGRGSSWLIGGETGVGKSRLLNELRTRALISGAVVLRGEGSAEGGLPYQFWRDALRRIIISVDVSDSEASILKQIISDIQELLGRPVEDAPLLEGPAGQTRLTNTIAQLFRRHTKPTVIFLEDLQWGVESVDILRRLNTLTPDLPLLIIGDYSSEIAPSLPSKLPEMNVLKLERLTDENIEALSLSILGNTGVKPGLMELLKKETEGNVFFLVETLRELASKAGQLRQISTMQLPTYVAAGGVKQVVQRRLSDLPADAMPLLKLAAVIGRAIDLKLLLGIESYISLDDWLIACSNAMILEVADEQWRFTHTQVRNQILEALTDVEQQELHHRVALGMEHVYESATDEYALLIADHYEQARRYDIAVEWFIRAAKHAQVTYAPQTAITYYQKALRYWEQGQATQIGHAARMEAYQGLGLMLNWQGRYDEAISVFEDMLESTEAEISKSHAWNGIAEAKVRQGKFPDAIAAAMKSSEIAEQMNAPLEQTQAGWMKAWSKLHIGEIDEALQLAEDILAISDKLHYENQRAQTFNLIGILNLVKGQYGPATQYFEQALEHFNAVGNRGPAMAVLNNLGVIRESYGDYEASYQHYEQALTIARELDNRDAEMVYLSNLGGIQVMLGQYSVAETQLLKVVEMAKVSGLSILSDTYRCLAEAYLGQTKFGSAKLAAEQALALGKEVGSADYIAAAFRVLGMIVTRGETSILLNDRAYTADECFAVSLRVASENHLEAQRASTLRAWAIADLQHDLQSARNRWYEARAIYEGLGAYLEAERMTEMPGTQADV